MSSVMASIDYDALAAALLAASAAAKLSVEVREVDGGEAVESQVGECGEGGKQVRAGDEGSGVGLCGDVVPGAVVGTEDVVSETSCVSEASSVEMPSGCGVSTAVRSQVRFGGLADVHPIEYNGDDGTQSGYYKTVVRRGEAVRLRGIIERLMGAKLPKAAREELAVCTFAAGVMPVVVRGGKERLRSLSVVGDAMITLALVTSVVSGGGNVESAQAVRSSRGSDTYLMQVCERSGIMGCITYPSGVDARRTKATATALEAVIGVVSYYRGYDVVARLLYALGVCGN